MSATEDLILIFANGVIADLTVPASYLARARFVIAADGGIGHLWALGRRPDLLIGDLDSLPATVEQWLEDGAMAVIRHPTAKDETDLELALLHAAAHFPEAALVVCGGFGGRLDQTLANILLLAHPALAGRSVRFVEGRETAWLITEDTRIVGHLGDTVSLIPLGGPARITATTGLEWPLNDETLPFGPARGVSNRLIAAEATVRLASGVLLCIHARAY
ncbi:thiamine diphosphokinase [Candidatus Promineifilum breve]|nr:thiamine diphosphokinase [Candidatus Promineifilum breve]